MSFLTLLSCANGISGGEVEPPVTIPTIYDTFGSNLVMFLDAENPVSMTTQGVFSNEVLTITTNDTNAKGITSNATEKTIWNGHSYYTRGASFLSFNSTAALYSFLHQASASTIAFRIYPANGLTGTHVLMGNNNNQATQKGVYVRWQDGNIVFVITNGTSGQTVLTASGPGGCSAGAWHDVVINITSSGATIEIDGVAGTTATNAFTRATGDAGFNFFMFRLSSTGTWGRDICIKNPMLINRVITSDEKALIRDHYLVGESDFGDGGLARVHFNGGQSNESGRASDFGSAPAYYDDPTGAMMFNKTNNTPDRIANYFAPHQLGVNCSTENQAEAGPDIEFAYRMNLLAPGEIYLVKYAVGGSDMYPVADPDWNYTGGTSDLCYKAFDLGLAIALKQLKYELNKEVSIEGFNWRQGENNTSFPNDLYYDYFRHLLEDRFKATVEAHGFNISNCRLCISSLDGFIPVRGAGCQALCDQLDAIAADAVDMGFAGGVTVSSVGYGLQGDGTHYNLAGQIAMGFDRYNYHKDFL